MSNEQQKSIFDCLYEKIVSKNQSFEWELMVDGASRGNPGKSGAGIYLKKNGKDFLKTGFFLGHKTNNEAEYLALLIGILFFKKEMQVNEGVIIISDSQLLIRQLEGAYRVKKKELQHMHKVIFIELEAIVCSFKHVEREYNTVADLLANQGIDKQKTLPLKILDTLKKHEIFL